MAKVKVGKCTVCKKPIYLTIDKFKNVTGSKCGCFNKKYK